jgi:Ras-related protein Rab-2A
LISINQKKVKLQIWDTAGQESFRSISRAYYRNAIGCILVYDMTRRETFTHLQSWLDDVSMHGNDLIRTCVVANKSDMESKRVISREEGEEFAKSNNLLYHEVSAKSGKNVEDVSDDEIFILTLDFYESCA